MTPFDQLCDALWHQMAPLSVRSKALVFLLSACRNFPFYEYCHQIKEVGDPVLLQQTLAEIYDHCVRQKPVSEETFREWSDTLLELNPEEDTGGLLCVLAEGATITADVAGDVLFHGSSFQQGAYAIEYCLQSVRFKIGLEKLGVSSPGDADAQHFYEVVLKDERFIQEKQNLESDIAALLQNGGTDFPALAGRLRTQALAKWNGEEFCRPLLELEAVYERQRQLDREQRRLRGQG